MKWHLLSIPLVVLLLGAAAQDDEVKKELKKFEGTWQLAKVETPDKDGPQEDVLAKTRFVFEGSKLRVMMGDGKVDEATFTINPTRKPKEIDVVPTQGPNKEKAAPGIYDFEGDTLKLCVAAPGGKRPTEFTADRSSRAAVMILKRAKP